jgi:CBS domain containing-hemolysin-like protein
LYCAYPLKIFAIILTPVVFIFEYITKSFTGVQGVPHMSDEEMDSFIDLGKDNGALDDGEHERIK